MQHDKIYYEIQIFTSSIKNTNFQFMHTKFQYLRADAGFRAKLKYYEDRY